MNSAATPDGFDFVLIGLVIVAMGVALLVVRKRFLVALLQRLGGSAENETSTGAARRILATVIVVFAGVFMAAGVVNIVLGLLRIIEANT